MVTSTGNHPKGRDTMQYAYIITEAYPSTADEAYGRIAGTVPSDAFYFASDWMDAEPFSAMDAAHDWFCIEGADEADAAFVGEYKCTVYERTDEDAPYYVKRDACNFRGHVCEYSTPDWVECID